MMTWDQVRELHDAGFDMQSHGLTHADLTSIPLNKAEQEIGLSKTCIENHVPGLNISIFANPYAKGGNDKEIVDIVSKYYDFARSGYSNTTYIGCDGWYVEDLKQPPNCSVYLPNGTLKFAHKYNLFAASHNNVDKAYSHDTPLILDDFKRFLNETIRLDDNGTIKALPILTYHNVATLEETPKNWWNSTTTPETFETEIKYMHDNGIRMLSMADLVLNKTTQKFHLRE